MRNYVAIIGDIIRSRNILSRNKVQKNIRRILTYINRKLHSNIVVPFTIIRGDEFQGLVNNLSSGYEIILELEKLLYPIKISYGVGFGTISTTLEKTTAEMDGECFHRSRQAIEDRKQNEQSIVFQTGNPRLDTAINTILSLQSSIKASWKNIHYRRIMRYEKVGSIEKVADIERVSFQAVSKTMIQAKYKKFKASQDTIKYLLKNVGTGRKNINNKIEK